MMEGSGPGLGEGPVVWRPASLEHPESTSPGAETAKAETTRHILRRSIFGTPFDSRGDAAPWAPRSEGDVLLSTIRSSTERARQTSGSAETRMESRDGWIGRACARACRGEKGVGAPTLLYAADTEPLSDGELHRFVEPDGRGRGLPQTIDPPLQRHRVLPQTGDGEERELETPRVALVPVALEVAGPRS